MSRTVVLAGASGYGRGYLRQLAALEAAGAVRLAGVCEVHPLDDEGRTLVGDRPVDTDLARLLDRTGAEIGIVATPIHTHQALGRQVLASGAHLLLEKPPTPTLAGWRELVELTRSAGLVCQLGFQSLASDALTRLSALIREGRLGELRGIGAYGAWSRTDGYYRRASWAGRREMDGVPVTDGALTNPFAHAVATALVLDGSTGYGDIAAVELELLRARDIQADDTSCVRLRTVRGTVVTVAVTLCAAVESEPVLVVHGSRGRAELHYTRDLLVVDGRAEHHGGTTLLENLLAHLDDPEVPLRSPVDSCGGFMRVLEAVRTAPDPVPIDRRWVRRRGEGDAARAEVAGVEDAVRTSAERLATFAELGVAWASQGSAPSPDPSPDPCPVPAPRTGVAG
ncbi:Gfo/Idh/MocA family protein [Peterkaempfera sp. SMS 1(5)a]|uniref:Gfo/Idh/MocA family protein n=1 Tax=Peterkaempfera podocarpi TaxID=3232308 RepID=UPI00366ED6EC